MPVHTVLLIAVKVAEQGVEGVARVLLNLVLKCAQHGVPLQSTGQGKQQRATWKNRKKIQKQSHLIHRSTE